MVLYFREATRVYRKTFPYVLLQFGIGVIFALFGVIYLSLVGWLAIRFVAGDGGLSLLIVAAVMLLGLLTFAAAWRLLHRYFLYLVKTGHIAVIAHVVEEDEVPDNQLKYGMEQVQDYFLSATGLFGVNEVVDAVLEQFTRATARLRDMIPVPIPPQLETLIDILQKSIVLAVKYLDEAIIAYMFVDRDENRWKSARDGIVLYGKTWKMVLGSTLVMIGGMYVLSFVLLTLLAPVSVALDVLPAALEAVSWLVVGGVVAVVHTGIVKPWVKTVVITTFLLEQRDEVPDEETLQFVSDHSERFSEVVEKAENNEPIVDEHPETGGASDVAGEAERGPA